MLIAAAVTLQAQSEAANTAVWPTSSNVLAPVEHGSLHGDGLDFSTLWQILGNLSGQIWAERFDRAECDLAARAVLNVVLTVVRTGRMKSSSYIFTRVFPGLRNQIERNITAACVPGDAVGMLTDG